MGARSLVGDLGAGFHKANYKNSGHLRSSVANGGLGLFGMLKQGF